MQPTQAITTCLRKTAQFLGRANRAEFWWFAMFWLPIACAAWFLVSPQDFSRLSHYGSWFLKIAICLPLLSAGARRCIDAGFSPAWIGNGFSGLLFSQGLIDIQRTALAANPTTWMTPVAAILAVVSAAALIYVLTRPSKPGPNSLEVTP